MRSADSFGNAIGNSIVGQIEETNGEQLAAQLEQGIQPIQQANEDQVNQQFAEDTQQDSDEISAQFQQRESLSNEATSIEQDRLANAEAGFTAPPPIPSLGNIQINIAQPAAEQQSNAIVGQLNQAQAETASVGTAPGYQQVLSSIAEARASDQAFYTDNIDNASSGFGAVFNSIGRSLNNAGYDLAQGAVSLYGLATDSQLRAQVLSSVGTAVAGAAENPGDTAVAAFNAGANYIADNSVQQIGEDALRLVAGGLATDGVGDVVGAAASVAKPGVLAAGEAFIDSLSSGGRLPSLAAEEGSVSLDLLVPGSGSLATDAADIPVTSLTGGVTAIAEESAPEAIDALPEAADPLAAFRAANPISARVLDFYQSEFEEGAADAEALRDAGQLKVPAGISEQTVIGQRADSAARLALRAALLPGGDLEDLADSVVVNRRLYDAGGSGNFRVPDVYIPSENVILDGTIGTKTIETPQVQDFFGFSNTQNVVIVKPNVAPQIITRPPGLAGYDF